MTVDQKNLLNDTLVKSLDDGLNLDASSKEYLTAMNATKIAHEIQVEQERFELEKAEKESRMALEEKKVKCDKRNAIANTIINGVKVVGLIAVSIWGVIYTTDFEKEDTVTTTAGRNAVRGVSDLYKKM